MFENARNWRVVVGGVAAGIAGVVGLAGTTASAEPVVAPAPAPAPVTVTQTVTVAPAAAATAPAALPAAAPVQAASAPAAVPAQPAAVPAAVPTQPAAADPGAAAPVLAAAAPAEPALTPATSGTLKEFLRSKNVTLQPQNPRDLTALKVTLPVPTGWSQVPDPNVPDAFAVIADRDGGDGLYTSNAQVVVYKLVGNFDPKEAITHGLIDSQTLPNWQSTDASLAPVGNYPSSLIEGTYRQNDMLLNTSRRHVIASAGPDKYLVTLSVTTSANQAVAAAPSTDAIVNGFRIVDPALAPPAPAAPVAPPAPGLPAALGAPAPGAPAAPAAAPAPIATPAPAAPVLPVIPGLFPAAS
jgi:hypothetical protein